MLEKETPKDAEKQEIETNKTDSSATMETSGASVKIPMENFASSREKSDIIKEIDDQSDISKKMIEDFLEESSSD